MAYVILSLQGNAKTWWKAECESRGGTQPDTLEEMLMLMRAQFESPVRGEQSSS